MNKRIHVVINPTSGQSEPILHTLNQVFRPTGVDWDVSTTKENGDGMKYAPLAKWYGNRMVANEKTSPGAPEIEEVLEMPLRTYPKPTIR